MAKVRTHLSRAPITEALIDFHVRLSSAADLSSLQGLAEQLGETYEQQGPIFQVQTKWSVAPKEVPRTRVDSQELGLRLHSRDGKYVLQTRLNGFTISRLEPYEQWTTLVAEARRLWAYYSNAMSVEAVTRIATRYINNLRLPMKHGESFEAYLSKPPAIPDDLPQGVLGFMQRIVLLNAELDIRANVIQLLQEGPVPVDHVPVILDIDVYKQVSCVPDAEDLWTMLPELRRFKNEIFFANLTEKAVELFA